MSPEEGVEILRKKMKDRSEEDERVLRGGQAHVTEQLRLSDEIQQHRDADVICILAPQQAVIEKDKETVTPVPGSSDDELVSSPESGQILYYSLSLSV